MKTADELALKRERLIDYLDRKAIDGVLLSKVSNFAWATAGARNNVGTFTESGVAALLILRDASHVITNNIEGPRIASEESIDAELITYPWFKPDIRQRIIQDLTTGLTVRSDEPVPGLELLDPDFQELSYSLTPSEVQRYTRLGKDCGEVVAEVARHVRIGQTEMSIAGALAEVAWSAHVVPLVILIGVDDRIARFRHPLPTGKKLRNYAMLALCGARNGLIVSLTRIVALKKPTRDLLDKHCAVTEVDAALIARTVPGACIGEIFGKAVETYEKNFFQTEWELHHQGGPTGYATRYYTATSRHTDTVQLNQAFAWNPSITGTKSEDTIIATQDKTYIISESRNWPMVSVSCDGIRIRRPDILVL